MRAPGFLVSPRHHAGVWAGIGAYCIWGALPLYWYCLKDVSPFLILCHRILWACVFLVPLALLTRRASEVAAALRDRKTMRSLFVSSVVLALNWGIFIWAVNNGRVMETSLGYFICPLITICLGVLLFRDRPSRLCQLSIGIAAAGVLGEIAINGAVPWAGLALSVSFSGYAVLRKLQPVESLPGLVVETALLVPFALAVILWTQSGIGPAAWGRDWPQTFLLMGAGVVTATPIVMVTYSARHVSLLVLGVLQYTYPLLSAMVGLFVFQEPLTAGRMASFAAAWAALAVYTVDGMRRHSGSEARE